MNQDLRKKVYNRLFEDLIGPREHLETISDRPTQRYSTGILYPSDTHFEAEEDLDADNFGGDDDDDSATSASHDGISLASTLKPSAAGISFALKKIPETFENIMKITVSCAVYQVFAIDENGNQIEGLPLSRKSERWRRVPKSCDINLNIIPGQKHTDLKFFGIDGLELYSLVRETSTLTAVTLALVNRKKKGESRIFDEGQHFFQTELSVIHLEGYEISPRPSKRGKGDEDASLSQLIYRDVKEFVVGHTCSAGFDIETDGRVKTLRTNWMPSIEVPRMSDQGDEVFWNMKSSSGESKLNAKWLSECTEVDLLSSLNLLVDKYEEWILSEITRTKTLPESLKTQALYNTDQCTVGARRMREGISYLKTDQNVRTSFQISQFVMNEQFGWSQNGKDLLWRPFQLAFQLLSLSSLSNRNHKDRDVMDLLWFPTGGGKTEAYLAQTAFIIVLRRLRQTATDDGSGVCAFMRYTLRLLTIQQFQRAAAMIFSCESLRRRGTWNNKSINLGSTPIGIGLWVGESATPTTLEDATKRRDNDPSRAEQLLICPCCKNELNWVISRTATTVRCLFQTCDLAKSISKLPIWTIDEEIYQNTPSLLIGTVDKFAQIVRKAETSKLFGRGFNKSAPDLIIQDELHLISGPLGTVSGVYEIAIDELCKNGDCRIKIIGSTATIRRAKDQAKSLFDRATYQFPSPGLDHTNSGFAKSDENRPGRLYVGLTTSGRSATYMLQAIASSLLQSAQEPGITEEQKDFYWTLVIYFNSLRELGRALVLMQDDVPVTISQFAAQRNETPRIIEAPSELTSRVKSTDIRDMLEKLKRVAGDTEAVNLLLASNMISVGMDVPRLAVMLVNAQPKTLSEYIQATSRVGRSHVPGLVITMYNNSRARDRSRFETFNTWHRCLYRDIEATSVTPFAARAQDKALHAVLVALARHLVPGLLNNPKLNDKQRSQVEELSLLIENRVSRIEGSEQISVSRKLKQLLDDWHERQDLQTYWDDYGKKISLLISAEQHAAKQVNDGEESETNTSAWPTPNSMREVEASSPFILRNYLRANTEDQNE